ncbi:hypothetical protein B5F71_19355 [Bacteroides sp. An269]|nr:hypothetical protein B5F71_19355 [Bacteroides sp. An269]
MMFMFGSLQPDHTGIDVPQPKGTKRIGETNRTVWKSRERVGGRGRKAVGILPFPPPIIRVILKFQ